ncbi:hypothetical protein D3C79_1040740 [compost metagenome]
MTLQGNAVDGRLHRGIQQFDYQRQQAGADHQRAFAAADVEEERQGNQHGVEQHQLAEGGFAGEGGAQAVQRIAGGVEDPFEAGLAFEWRHIERD